MKVAIVHYWLTGMRGGERVLESIAGLFPDADIFTNVLVAEKISEKLRNHRIHTTFINSLPFSSRHYPKYLMLMPRALELLDLSGYDLVISSESGPAKGIIPRPDAPHFCYCHTPMRYIWDRQQEYRSTLGVASRMVFDATAHKMRIWDVSTAARVDHFIANSRFVSQRIHKYYRRNSKVIHPPVSLERFSPATAKGSYYLFVSELVPYKRADIAVQAFNGLNRHLIVVGDGPDRKRLAHIASSNVEFKGRVSDQELEGLYRGARALIFPGIEDFGIVPLEAMACGRPVIAYGVGGALETIVPGVTGLLFSEQRPDALATAVKQFEDELEDILDPSEIVAHAQGFSPERFKREFMDHLLECEPGLKGLTAL
jgi:glycosyltransferase involved in cell wall biosynthesis